MKLADLAARLQGQLIGDGGLDIVRVADLRTAGTGDISFLTSAEYRPALATTSASAVLLKVADAEHCPVAAIVVASPYLAYAKVAQWLDPTPVPQVGNAPTASIDPSVNIPGSASIGPGAVIGSGCVLGEGVVIGANVVLAENVSVGAGSRIYPNVTVYHGVSIGAGCRIHSGTVIGSDGFGYAQEQRQWVRIPQVGTVRIADEVDIGANCTIDRGALGDTVIEQGVKLDNLIHIAHNVQIGAHTAIAGCSAVAGSAVIGKHVTLAGRVGVLGHLSVCDNVHVTATTLVTKSITEPGVYSSGTPFQDNRSWRKNAARFNQLDDLARRLRRLEKASGT